MTKLFVTVMVSLFLYGCASMNKDECKMADWKNRGRMDGLEGRPSEFLASHTKACSEHGIKPDAKLYQVGRKEGIQSYCTPRNGLAHGKGGKTYSMGTCPSKLEGPYFLQFKMGEGIYKNNKEIERLTQLMAANDKRIISYKTSSSDRENYLNKNKGYQRRIDALKKEMYLLKGNVF